MVWDSSVLNGERPVHVLHIQKVAGIAGSENHLLTLLPRLREHGYAPAMLVLADRNDRPDTFVERMRESGISTEIMPMISDVAPLLLLRLVRFIRTSSCDLVHTHLLHADLYGRLAGRVAGAKVISTYHCDDPFHLIRGIRHLDRLTALLCSQIICISESVRAFVRNRIGLRADRLSVVSYGLDPDRLCHASENLRRILGLGDSTILVGIVARLTAQKGHIYLLQAMHEVITQIPSCHLVVIGDGEERQRLQALTISLGIKEHVHFLGYRCDASSLIRELNIFALPSLYEGFGLVVLEAMAAAKPIIATLVSAIPELVADGESGVLVPPRDSKALAQGIVRLATEPFFARKLGQEGRARLERLFTVDKMLQGTVQVYRAVIAS